MNATEIVAYTFNADTYHPSCLISAMVLGQELSPAALNMGVEEVLDQHAGANGIDREDEHSFDSSEFPKVIFADQVESDDEICGHCGDPLVEIEIDDDAGRAEWPQADLDREWAELRQSRIDRGLPVLPI